MAHDLNKDVDTRRDVLVNSPVIAIVGRSSDHYYSSYDVGKYLIQQGYTVYNVNPMIDGDIDGDPVYDSLKDVPVPIDIVDVFRRSDFLEDVVDDAIAVGAKTVWAQLGIEDEDARLKALGAGLNYAENMCIRTEHERLFKGMVQG
jgi:uncharacterized protein